MAPPALAPVSRPDGALKIATGSQRARRVLPALADKLLSDLWGE
jgi:hypothetical protein